jgi:hypothetical protein
MTSLPYVSPLFESQSGGQLMTGVAVWCQFGIVQMSFVSISPFASYLVHTMQMAVANATLLM